jgi:fumarylacetoacetase
MTHPLYGSDNLPYGSLIARDGRRFAAVRFGDHALDLSRLDAGLFAGGTLDALLAGGRETWAQVRAAVIDVLAADVHPLVPLGELTPVLGFTVADYVDFFASEHHATNAGRIFRPHGEPLTPNWKHLPVGYHGRAGTLVVSGTPIRRPSGQHRDGDGIVRFGASRRLDFEAEVAFVIGTGSAAGTGICVENFAEHVFGVCLLNDWSARDIQAWESAPLGPHLGKSFATSVSGWITPLAALERAWIAAPARDPAPLPYLDDSSRPNGLDLNLTVMLNAEEVSHPRFASMYWTAPQLLAHLTSNGAPVRTGDVFASGTVSGPERGQRGCLLELSWNGTDPLHLADGTTRSYLEDADEVTITATAPTASGRLALGEVRGRVCLS